jgi:hypothetical protein
MTFPWSLLVIEVLVNRLTSALISGWPQSAIQRDSVAELARLGEWEQQQLAERRPPL